jgi:phosphatidylglycerophosphate synthase
MRIVDLREQIQRKTGNLYDTYFTRRISIYVTMAAFALGISANAISALNWFVAIIACLLIGTKTGTWLYIGIACVHLHAVLDSVDGELARLRQRFTIQGLFLEDLCAFTMINGMFLAIGAYVARTQWALWPVVLAVAVVAFGRNAMQVGRRAIIASIASKRKPPMRSAAGPQTLLGLRAFFENTVLHFTNMWVVCTTLIVVEQFTHPRLVMYVYLFFASAVLLKELAVIATYTITDELERQVADLREQARDDST